MEEVKLSLLIDKTVQSENPSKSIENNLLSLVQSYRSIEDIVAEQMVELNVEKKDLPKLLDKLEKDMHKAAKLLDFERAIEIRDQIKKIKSLL